MSDKKIIAVIGATGAQGGGLARAIAADERRPVRRTRDHAKSGFRSGARARALGVDIVKGDADHAASLEHAFAGAYGAFCVTNFWEHLSAEREGRQALAMAHASRKADLQHVVWSTLEDTRTWIPLTDTRMPTLHGQFNVPHFDSKGQMNQVFADEAAPTTFMQAAFYWENFIAFGMGPRATAEGKTILALPLGGAKLPGIGVEDVGRCAYGIFKIGPNAVGRHFGIAGEVLSGPEMARKMGHLLGRNIDFVDIPFDAYRSLGFPRRRGPRQHVPVPGDPGRRIPERAHASVVARTEPGAASVRLVARRAQREDRDPAGVAALASSASRRMALSAGVSPASWSRRRHSCPTAHWPSRPLWRPC